MFFRSGKTVPKACAAKGITTAIGASLQVSLLRKTNLLKCRSSGAKLYVGLSATKFLLLRSLYLAVGKTVMS